MKKRKPREKGIRYVHSVVQRFDRDRQGCQLQLDVLQISRETENILSAIETK